MPEWTLSIGDRIRRSELHRRYGGSIQAGIAPSARTPNIFIFDGLHPGEDGGYSDTWSATDGCFHYVGEGQRGDQRMSRGNRAIAESAKSGRALRLFRRDGDSVEYLGRFALDETEPFYRREALDVDEGELRSVIVFRLRSLQSTPRQSADRTQALPNRSRYSFGNVEFDELTFELRVSGKPVAAQRRDLEMLALLLRRIDRWVTREELLETVWRGLQVSDRVLAAAVARLRKALGEKNAIRLLSHSRLGYQLVGPAHRNAADYGNLEQWAENHLSQLSVTERVTLFLQIADSTAAAHHARVVQEALTPRNIRVRRADDGWHLLVLLVHSAEGKGSLGSATSGSVASDATSYRAPELLQGGSPTTQSDLYALGVILYQLIAGNMRAGLAPGWERAVENAALAEVIARMTAGRPEHRPASAAELAATLRRILNAPQAAQAPSVPRDASEPSSAPLLQSFLGREAELQALDNWAQDSSSPLLVVHGPARVGKTALCAVWMERRSQGDEDTRHLMYSFHPGETTLYDLYRAAFAVLGSEDVLNLGIEQTPAADLAIGLLELLRTRLCLLTLDDVDLVPAACEQALADLLKSLAQLRQTKIIVTSRTVPAALLNTQRHPIPGVRLYALEGPGPIVAEGLLHQIGVTGTSQLIRRFFQPIDYHPLAIQSVAAAIKGDGTRGDDFDSWLRSLCAELQLAADPRTLDNWHIGSLSILLRKLFTTSPMINRILTDLADRHEQQARELLCAADPDNALHRLADSIGADPLRESRLAEEFAFIFSFSPEARRPRLNPTRSAQDASNWRRQIWSALANGNPDQFLPTPASEPAPAAAIEKEPPSGQKAPNPDGAISPERKGEQLEQAVARLFQTFLALGEEIPLKVRQQKRGTQNGYDLSIEWTGSCEVAGHRRVRVHIECKNYREAISHDLVGGKLLVEGQVQPAAIDHWILVSPHTNPSNELNRFLEAHQRTPQYAFDIQVWSPESGVRELFGLDPQVYGELYGFEAGEPDPRTWSAEKREEVRQRWMTRLRPPARLPTGWLGYATDPDKLCSPPETPSLFQEAAEHAVPMRCLSAAGILLDQPLRHYVGEWLESNDRHPLFVLGEFGDGKTFFTYVLARELTQRWLADDAQGWLTLRLPLKKYPGNARDFLRQRLEEFGADVAGWLDLGKRARRLVILDGFDEMSVAVGPSAVTRNITNLLACVKEFEGCKVLITSRTHFFASRLDAQRLMARLGNPAVYQLAPIQRSAALRNIETYLAANVGLEAARERLTRIEALNDPIGLAQKPLYLQMVKVVLSKPTLPDNLRVVELYENYIDESLSRNGDRLDDNELQTDPTQTIPNLRRILGELAEDLQRSGRGWVSLSRFKSREQQPLARLLWRLSEGGEEQEQDARVRVGARSLLGRVPGTPLEEGWPVDFCHRSMKEYFVAIRLCESVEAGFEPGLEFLQSVPLNHEILHFAAERWRAAGGSQVVPRLLRIIEAAVPATKPGLGGGYALTLLYRLNPVLPRDFDWRHKVLDGVDLEEADLSGFDFTGASFVGANLANANLESASFEGCNLTGVHLEETRAVVSLAAGPSSDEILALYGDGTLRKWQLSPGRDVSRIAISVDPEPGSVVGLHTNGQAWLQRRTRWSFLTPREPDQQWLVEGTFPIKENYECITPCGDLLAYLSRIDDRRADFVLADVARQEVVSRQRLSDAQRCVPLGTEGLLWSDPKGGLYLEALGQELAELTSRVTLETSGVPTSLASWRCRPGVYLVAIGTEEGTVSVERVTLNSGEWAIEPILSRSSHQGAVTALAFLSDSQLASGGSDRVVSVVRFTGGTSSHGMQERRLQRTLRCKNMKIEGVQSAREYEMLKAYIVQSEKGGGD